jgi:hypothetical protein
MLDPKEFHKKLVEYPETNLLPEERQAIEMIFNLIRQLFGWSIDKLPKEQQLSLITVKNSGKTPMMTKER